ncbi:MAG: type IV-A pilus assembly ATPase PilB [Legionellales bacterium]|nr:type IV-A pilus assembly ATPase PilB [Legionellales bacterium]
MSTPSKVSYSGLARRLVLDGLLDENQAKEAAKDASQAHVPFVTYLVSKKILAATQIAHAAATDFGVPLIDIEHFDHEAIPKTLVEEKLIRKHHALPLFQRGNRLYVALSDPTNLNALDEIKFHTGINTYSVLVEEDKLTKLIEEILTQQEDTSFSGFDDESLDDLNIEEENESEQEVNATDANDAPIVRFVNKVLLDAINKGASDIHFEPYEKNYRVRFRIDGILYEIANPPINLASRITARLKVMAKLDISERRIPQDGHIKMKLSRRRSVDFRVNTTPVTYGEKVVLRILDASQSQVGIDKLGYEDFQRELFMNAIHRPQGLVLVTGPTGSGKTVSLYTALNILNTTERNISTAEDPVELPLEGINQVQVNPKTGFTFALALRAFLRQDPDVIMVGETRDLETAEICIKASQTGHLVLSTLHTNSAPETLTRLANMGIPGYNIATSVSLIIAQRLARRLCEHCKQPMELPPPEILLREDFLPEEANDPNLLLYKPVGCDRCTNGYSGRLGIYEVMLITEGVSRIIMDGGNSIQIRDKAVEEGLQTLRRSALIKTMQGITSLAEANRVTKD